MTEISGKAASARSNSNFGGPAGGEALSRAEPPAGPPKFGLLFADATFPEISVIFGIMPGPLLLGNFF